MAKLLFQIVISEYQKKKINEYKDKGLSSNDIVVALSAPVASCDPTIKVFCRKSGEYVEVDRRLFKSKKIEVVK